ncbi:transposable element Tcb2 transposase [Trichonephila clavipes]|nr:transposable element Tcb2 transposase [Trichonephila clavipes]
MYPAFQVEAVEGHDGSIMAWGVLSWHCLVSLLGVPTSLHAILYVESTSDHLHPFLLFCYPHERLKGHHTAPTNLSELRISVSKTWQLIPVERFQTLVEFMPCSVAAVIKANGDPTRF